MYALSPKNPMPTDAPLPKPLTLSRIYQIRANAKGRCGQCFRGRVVSGGRCKGCLKRDRDAKRKKLGLRPWRKGGRGRPPAWAKKLDSFATPTNPTT